MSRRADSRLPALAGLILLWLLALGSRGLAGSQADPPIRPEAIAAEDSLPTDSVKVDPFLPLNRRPAPGGLFVSSLVHSGRELWAVGDSGFIARGPSDTLLKRLSHPGRAALHCAVWWDEALVCAGDSGRVLRAEGNRVGRVQLPDLRAVRAISRRGRLGLLGGDEGLLARSLDAGAHWDTLAAPLPMRFHAVLCQDSLWWAGGAGGRLFRSADRGLHWLEAERLPSAVADLAEAPDGSLRVLEKSGALSALEAGGLRPLGKAEVGQARRLSPAPGGWAVGGEGGKLAILDEAAGEWSVQSLPEPTVISGLLPWKGGLLLSGAWNTLAVWQPDGEGPRLLRHSLSVARPAQEEEVAAAAAAAADSLPREAESEVAEESGARYFQNVLDTDTRCTTPPARQKQLERSLNHMRWLGVSGHVMLVLDVGSRGQLDSIQVLDEWPSGLGLGDQARRLAEGLTFTPGFRKSGMVRSRLLFPVVLPSQAADHLGWAKGESAATQLLDSLMARMPLPRSPLSPKALVKALGFPRKAKRFIWEGQAVLEYELGAAGPVNPRVLWESDEQYGFGKHALQVLPKLDMRLPDSLALAPGDHLLVTQKLSFDRRQYRRAVKAVAEGVPFSQVLSAVARPDSARYEPGLQQLEWLLNDFQTAEAAGWPELELELVLRHDGRLQDFKAVARAETGSPLETETLRSLALLFTWGRPRAETEDKLDSLKLVWRPRAFQADSTNRPATLEGLLRDVVY